MNSIDENLKFADSSVRKFSFSSLARDITETKQGKHLMVHRIYSAHFSAELQKLNIYHKLCERFDPLDKQIWDLPICDCREIQNLDFSAFCT